MLLIHIGLHKTGTTTFQNQLWDNRGALLKSGILYPKSCSLGKQHCLLPGSLIPNHPFLPQDRTFNTDSLIEELAAEIHKSKPELTLLSSEVFSECIRHNPKGCMDIINKLPGKTENKHILVSLRAPIEYALSSTKNCIRANLKLALNNPVGVFRGQLETFEKNINFWTNTPYKTTIKHLEMSSQNIAYNFLKIQQIPILDPHNSASQNLRLKKLFNQTQKIKNEDKENTLHYFLYIIWKLSNEVNAESFDKFRSFINLNKPPKAVLKLAKQPSQSLSKFLTISSNNNIEKLPISQRISLLTEVLEKLFEGKVSVDKIMAYLVSVS